MTDNCPFCGADIIWSFEHSTGLDLNFYCETALRGSDIWIRGNPCCEAELARKDELLREAVNKLRQIMNRDTWTFSEIQAFLTIPEVVKVMEEKP